MRKLRLAICGIRGIPACYGGFETFAEELSSRLVARGHDVVVYGRRHVISNSFHAQRDTEYRGVDIRLLWAPQRKYLETPVHTLLCLLDLLCNPVDVVLVCNAANSPFIWLLRLFGIPVAVNVDGIERLRKKWNVLGRWWYYLGERCSVWFASRVIADAQVIRDYYFKRYRCDACVIPYGFNAGEQAIIASKLASTSFAEQAAGVPTCQELGLTPGRYLLYVSRLEPENNAHVVIEAYNSLPQHLKTMPLLIVGDAPYAKEYIAMLKRKAGKGVVFAGFRFGPRYAELQLYSYLYVQATEVGGTHPALVEAMGFANCVVANDTPENREVLGDSGLFYEKNNSTSLRLIFEQLLGEESLICNYRQRAFKRATDRYNWEIITDLYERLFCDVSSAN